MKLLLDTHALIWYIEESSSLSVICKKEIESESKVFVSIVSLWEIAIKMNLGKLGLKSSFQNLKPKLKEIDIDILPVSFEDAERYLALPLHHRDPFDRMLIAQSLEHDLTLVSKESLFDLYGIKRLW